MKTKTILVFFTLLLTIISGNAQIKVNSSGKTIIGPTTTWADFMLNITGSGTLGSGSDVIIGFGDNTTSTKNVLIGEYGSTDTDQLLLHGDNGIYFSTTESINNRMFLSDDGNLGIGTSSPDYDLDVNGTIIATSRFRVGTNLSALYTANNYHLEVGSASTGCSVGLHSGDVNNALYVKSTGYIGIGTTSPQEKLDVYNGNFRVYNGNFRLFGYKDLLIQDNSGSDPGDIIFMNSSGSEKARIWSYSYGLSLRADGGYPDIHIETDYGNVAIGASFYDEYNPYKLKVYGDIYVTGSYLPSDRDCKKDITPLTNCLNRLLKLQGSSYYYKADKLLTVYQNNSENDTIPNKDFIRSEIAKLEEQIGDKQRNGFIAQDFQKIFPELVKVDQNGGMAIDYISLIPVIIETIKEQQAIIEGLSDCFNNLKSGRSSNLNGESISLDDLNNFNNESAKLFQNHPNPFDTDTEIKFYIPDRINNAQLYIYNMQGNQLSGINITQRGYGSEIIHGSYLLPGMYMYTLIVDNREADTKRMILTE